MPEGWKAQKEDLAIKGWNVQSIVDTYMARWPDFVKSLEGTSPFGISPEFADQTHTNIYFHNLMMCYAYSLAVAVQGKTSVSILDWGGGIGHYYLLSKALFPNIQIDYHCKDLPLIAAQGQKIVRKRIFTPKNSSVEPTLRLHFSQQFVTLLGRLVQNG